jgi:hypothetical protein
LGRKTREKPQQQGRKKKRTQNPEKNPELEAATRRQENGKIAEKKKDREPKPSGRTGIIIIFVPSFLKKKNRSREETNDREKKKQRAGKQR